MRTYFTKSKHTNIPETIKLRILYDRGGRAHTMLLINFAVSWSYKIKGALQGTYWMVENKITKGNDINIARKNIRISFVYQYQCSSVSQDINKV